MKPINRITTMEKVETYNTMMPLLNAMYLEFKDLCKKNSETAVSKNKIKITNRLLERVRTVLSGEESINFLDILDEDDIPQVSDVTLILSQYVASMRQFEANYYRMVGSRLQWLL